MQLVDGAVQTKWDIFNPSLQQMEKYHLLIQLLNTRQRLNFLNPIKLCYKGIETKKRCLSTVLVYCNYLTNS